MINSGDEVENEIKTFEDLHASVIKTFKAYMEDAGKILCVMKKMREDFAITVGFLPA